VTYERERHRKWRSGQRGAVFRPCSGWSADDFVATWPICDRRCGVQQALRLLAILVRLRL